jgi:adenosylcobinamide kinase/adenosylcobinamide-phosphate guanylyltransferase
VNLHVPKDFQPAPGHGWEDCSSPLVEFAERRGIAAPFVGFLTSAWTEHGEIVVEQGHGLTALVAVTVGLGNRIAAGISPAAALSPSTINVIVVVDAAPDMAAMVNAIITVTEVKTSALILAGVTCDDGQPATGTSTDAIAIAATGHGRRCYFGGPISDLGSVIARGARRALERGIAGWSETNG